MPRKTPLSEREIAICTRLREFREVTQLNRVAFARTAGVDVSLLFRHEFYRVPLRYGAAYKILMTFGLNAGWLATGKGPHVLRVPLPDPGSNRAQQQELFSAVYDATIGPLIAQALRYSGLDLFEHAEVILPDSPYARFQLAKYLSELTHDATCLVPTAKLDEFLKLVMVPAYRLLRSYPRESEETITAREHAIRAAEQGMSLDQQLASLQRIRDLEGSIAAQRKSQMGLDSVSTHTYSTAMTSAIPATMPDLVDRLRRATSAYGARANLAREFSVPRQTVNAWLNGRNAPSGEVVLRLVRWVLQVESQKQGGPGDVTSIAKAKTQRKNRFNDKSQTSGPKSK